MNGICSALADFNWIVRYTVRMQELGECDRPGGVFGDFGRQWLAVDGSDSHSFECGSGYRQIRLRCNTTTLYQR